MGEVRLVPGQAWHPKKDFAEILQISQEEEFCFMKVSVLSHRTICIGSDAGLRKLVMAG